MQDRDLSKNTLCPDKTSRLSSDCYVSFALWFASHEGGVKRAPGRARVNTTLECGSILGEGNKFLLRFNTMLPLCCRTPQDQLQMVKSSLDSVARLARHKGIEIWPECNRLIDIWIGALAV